MLDSIYIIATIFVSGIMRLDARARQDVAMLGSEFLKLDGNISNSLSNTKNFSGDIFIK